MFTLVCIVVDFTPADVDVSLKDLPPESSETVLLLASKRTSRGENESTMTPSLIALTELLKLFSEPGEGGKK
jgi:hypothetical protein